MESSADNLKAQVLRRSVAGQQPQLTRRQSGDAQPFLARRTSQDPRPRLSADDPVPLVAATNPPLAPVDAAALGGAAAVERAELMAAGSKGQDTLLLSQVLAQKKGDAAGTRQAAEIKSSDATVFEEGELLSATSLTEAESRYVAKFSIIDPPVAKVLSAWPHPAVRRQARPVASSRLKRLCCMKLPLTYIPWLIPVACILAGAAILAVGLVHQDFVWLGSPIWCWGAVVMMTTLEAVVVQIAVRLFTRVWLRNRAMQHMQLYYVCNNIDRSFAIVCALALAYLPLQLMIAYGLDTATRGTIYLVYGCILVFVTAYLVNEIATKLMVGVIEGPKVLFRRLAVLFWERDVLVRVARHLVLRESGELGVQVASGSVPERPDGFRMFSRGPVPSDVDWAEAPRSASERVMDELRYDEPVLEAWAQYVKGSTEWQVGVAESILALEKRAARDIRRLTVAFKFVVSLWKSLHKTVAQTVTEKDLVEWMDGDTVLAREAMSLFNSSMSGAMSFEECIEVAGVVLRDRCKLEKLLKDRTTFTRLLFRFIAIIVWPIAFIIFSTIVGLDLASLLAPLITFVLGLTFIFGTSLMRMWHAFLMIFIARAFEPGDYIAVDGLQDFLVEDIGLLTTTGCNSAGLNVRISNWMLWERSIVNYGRCAEARLRMFFRVDASSTSEEQIRELERLLRQHIADNEHLFRLKTFAFWLSAGHGGEKHFWSELDELSWHTIGFQVKLTRIDAGSPGKVNDVQTDLLLEFKKMCGIVGIKAAPHLLSMTEEKLRDQQMGTDTRVTAMNPIVVGQIMGDD